MAVDPVGNAAFFWVDWDTGEQRVKRRSIAGFYGQERAVVSCPRTRTYPLVAAVDPLGNASLLWNESSPKHDYQGIRLSQDSAATGFSPDPCPAPPPPLVWTPKDPAPGQPVTFDTQGFHDYYGDNLTTFKWDLDGDGTFETDSGETTTVSHVFETPGEHRIGLQVASHSRTSGNGGSSTCQYTIHVGDGTANEYPSYYADPRPPDLPDENPWPVAPSIEPPQPLPELPPGTPIGLPAPSLLDQPVPAGPPPAVQPRRRGLTVDAARSISARALLREGMPVRLASARKVRVALRLLTGGGRTLAGPAKVTVRPRRLAIVAVKPNRAGRRMLRKGHLGTLTLQAAPARGSKVRQRIRLG
jgi:PKD domain